MIAKMSEVEIAKVVIGWLQDLRWEVYQEVQIGACGPIADIVAVQDKLLWIIEVKRSLGLSVIGQALHWKTFCHYVSVAVPYKRWTKEHDTAVYFMKRDGIGLLKVQLPSEYR
ncbi:MAG: MmcB family DNA repair protein [Thermodesulfobacteriota bacterium]